MFRFEHLTPGTEYKVEFSREVRSAPGGSIADSDEFVWQTLRTGLFTTLPGSLPVQGKGKFTIGLGSCFYNDRDGGRAAESYKRLYELGSPETRPDITFLVGDQVYLDIGFDSLSMIPDEIRERAASDYAMHWQALGSIFSRG